jgi:hypothetical protein
MLVVCKMHVACLLHVGACGACGAWGACGACLEHVKGQGNLSLKGSESNKRCLKFLLVDIWRENKNLCYAILEHGEHVSL